MRKTDSLGHAFCPSPFYGREGSSMSVAPMKIIFAAIATALVLFAVGCGKEAKSVPRQVNGVRLVDRRTLPLYTVK
ncbi:hypothetical protein SDC9_70887 [bioreactor metagenome]|uniref:Uncharacterized protein n=1 Tax=bioreactor metagenome TaxID=1076179 RepID=A0A644Y771_9ZZZZ